MNIDLIALQRLCEKNRIASLKLFGSAIRDDFAPTSDVDVLVEFEPGYRPGLSFFAIERELEVLIGRPVDLHTPKSLSRYFRSDVLGQAKVLYVAP